MNNINNLTISRANPPFKGGRGDFFLIITIMNNINNFTTSRANPPFKVIVVFLIKIDI